MKIDIVAADVRRRISSKIANAPPPHVGGYKF
jgi:hypothetical protein